MVEVIIQILSSIAVRNVSAIGMNYTCLDFMEQAEYVMDFSLNMAFIILKLLEETLSQNLKIGLSFLFMSKNGKIFIMFS